MQVDWPGKSYDHGKIVDMIIKENFNWESAEEVVTKVLHNFTKILVKWDLIIYVKD